MPKPELQSGLGRTKSATSRKSSWTIGSPRADTLPSGSQLGGSVLIVDVVNPRPTDSVSVLFTGNWEFDVSDILDSPPDCEHGCEGNSSNYHPRAEQPHSRSAGLM